MSAPGRAFRGDRAPRVSRRGNTNFLGFTSVDIPCIYRKSGICRPAYLAGIRHSPLVRRVARARGRVVYYITSRRDKSRVTRALCRTRMETVQIRELIELRVGQRDARNVIKRCETSECRWKSLIECSFPECHQLFFNLKVVSQHLSMTLSCERSNMLISNIFLVYWVNVMEYRVNKKSKSIVSW